MKKILIFLIAFFALLNISPKQVHFMKENMQEKSILISMIDKLEKHTFNVLDFLEKLLLI